MTRTSALPLDEVLLTSWPMSRSADGDKFDHGTVLVVGGATETPGAVILAGMAALRMGAGRLQIATARSVAAAVAVAVPEALVVPVDRIDDDGLRSRIAAADAVLVGPGAAADDGLCDAVRAVVDVGRDETVLVVDAAALRVVADLDPRATERWRGRTVITPNRGEVASLLRRLGADPDDLAPDAVLRELSARTGAVVTSFGEVCTPDGRHWRSSTGHPSLGTSGSGDVLAGLVAGAAARAGDAAQATCWATWAHTAGGALLGSRHGAAGFLARELLDVVGEVLPVDHDAAPGGAAAARSIASAAPAGGRDEAPAAGG